MNPVFADTSSLILIQKAGLFDPFSNLFSLVIPQSVFNELTQSSHPDAVVFEQAVNLGKLAIRSTARLDCFKGLCLK